MTTEPSNLRIATTVLRAALLAGIVTLVWFTLDSMLAGLGLPQRTSYIAGVFCPAMAGSILTQYCLYARWVRTLPRR